ncbi:MAG: methyltransferase domain-containing protein [Bacteroidota bacterium]
MSYLDRFKKTLLETRQSVYLLISRMSGNEQCLACGFKGRKRRLNVLWPDLINEWELSPEWVAWVNDREGTHCVNCGCSERTNQLAGVILSYFDQLAGIKSTSLQNAFDEKAVQALTIAEINSAGTIHKFLARSPNLFYSEYASSDPAVPSENLMKLSYQDNFFDIVITSETLEHVPDIDIALKEIYRVLKPGAAHLFTTPVIWDRPSTRVRAKIEEGKLIYLMTPSHHGSKHADHSDYLVFYEFGADLVKRCEDAGFQVSLTKHPVNPSLVTFCAIKK